MSRKERKDDMNRKATQKMIDYAKYISEWVGEKMPDSDDFQLIGDYINRNKEYYRNQINELNLMHETMMEFSHSDWGDRL